MRELQSFFDSDEINDVLELHHVRATAKLCQKGLARLAILLREGGKVSAARRSCPEVPSPIKASSQLSKGANPTSS